MIPELSKKQQVSTFAQKAQLIGLYLNLYAVDPSQRRNGLANNLLSPALESGISLLQQQALERQRARLHQQYLTPNGSHDNLQQKSQKALFTHEQLRQFEQMREHYQYGLYDTLQTVSNTDTSQFTQQQLEKLVEVRDTVRRNIRQEFADDISLIKHLRERCFAAGISFINKNEDGTNQKIAYDPILDVFNLLKIRDERPDAVPDFRQEVIKNLITNILERYRSDRSVHRYHIKDEQLYSEYFQNEPFTRIIARGISHLQEEGSFTQIREKRELEGFKWKEKYFQTASIGDMVLFLSPPYLERYPENYIDIAIKRKDQITGEIFIEEIRFKYDSLTENHYWNIATGLDPFYFDGFLQPPSDANPNKVMTKDAWCVGKGIPVHGDSPDAVFKTLVGSIDPEKEAKIDFILKSCEEHIIEGYVRPLIQATFTTKQDWVRLGKSFQSLQVFSHFANELYERYGDNHQVLDNMDKHTAMRHVFAYIKNKVNIATPKLVLKNTVDVSYENYLPQQLPPIYLQNETLSALTVPELAIGCGRSGNVLITEGTNSIAQEAESRSMGTFNRLARYNSSKIVAKKEKSKNNEGDLFQCPRCDQYFVPPVGNQCPTTQQSIAGIYGCGLTIAQAAIEGVAVCA